MGLKSTFVAGMMVVICMVLYHRAISAEGELLDWRQQASGLKAELRGAKHEARGGQRVGSPVPPTRG